MKIHFVGIGGIGLSGLAQYLHFLGHEISGSDIKNTTITKKLHDLGINITIPHNKQSIISQDLVIISAVIKPNNPEVIAAQAKNIQVLSRKEALKDILSDKEVFSVAGAHGKSTTTAILASILKGSAIIGAESKAFESNVRCVKNTNRVIFEADESDASFLNSNPFCAIVINAEPEHMEYYNYDYELFFESYKKFVLSAKYRILNAEDSHLAKLAQGIEAEWLYPSKDIKNIQYTLIDNQPYTQFDLLDFGTFNVWGFGKHIALDASLAILAAKNFISIKDIQENIQKFQGIKKRFDIVGSCSKNIIIDDYAHHPTEITATLESVQEYKKLKKYKKVTAIWQPHKYSRTLDNFEAFKKCFHGVDELVILPVWAAGEDEISIDFEKEFQNYNLFIAKEIERKQNSIEIITSKNEKKIFQDGIIIGFGAGDITYKMRGEL